MLEKRVKSRFSQRILHVTSPRSWTEWSALARSALVCPTTEDVPQMDKFKIKWDEHVDVGVVAVMIPLFSQRPRLFLRTHNSI